MSKRVHSLFLMSFNAARSFYSSQTCIHKLSQLMHWSDKPLIFGFAFVSVNSNAFAAHLLFFFFFFSQALAPFKRVSCEYHTSLHTQIQYQLHIGLIARLVLCLCFCFRFCLIHHRIIGLLLVSLRFFFLFLFSIFYFSFSLQLDVSTVGFN